MFENMTTDMTSFRGWEEPINLRILSPVPSRLIRELTDGLTPGNIPDCLSEAVIFHHIYNSQILSDNVPVSNDNLSGEFMQEVLATIRDLCMKFPDLLSGFLPVLPTLCAAAQTLLKHF